MWPIFNIDRKAGAQCYASFKLLGIGITLLSLIGASDIARADPVKKGPRLTAAELGLMKGFHEPGDHIVDQLNWSEPPYSRWGMQNVQALLPSAAIHRTDTPVTALPKSNKAIDGLMITDEYDTVWTFDEVMESTYTDAFLVVHNGKIVLEKYWNGMKPWTPHILFSISKSYTGLLAGILESEGKLDLSNRITDYIPKLKNTAWYDTTIRSLIDMNTAVGWSEHGNDYVGGVDEMKNPMLQWTLANNWMPMRPEYGDVPDGSHDFLSKLPKKAENKQAFLYKSVDTDMAAWVFEAASGESFADLMTSRIWSKIGAEQDAAVIVDQYGAAAGSWGMSVTLRDMGRVGMMMAAGGSLNGEQIIPKEFAADIMSGGDKKLWKKGGRDRKGSYRSFWWHTGNDRKAYFARGAYGQYLYIDPKSNTAIVRFASQPGENRDDMDKLIMAVFDKVIEMVAAP